MFTGWISDLGEVLIVDDRGDRRLRLATGWPPSEIALGASIACSGVCLTVVDRGTDNGRHWFEVDASAETLSATTLGAWREGTAVNLERALKVGDELAGHIVSGHVDGTAEVVSVEPSGDSSVVWFEVPEALARFVAPKGSVALDGASLTVNAVDGCRFSVNLIPHTKSVTTLGDLAQGRRVNLEIDVLARYVARLAETG